MPKIVDHDERREQIVDATWRLIHRGGFEKATMREIAAEAGFAHGALQRYFPNKESVLAAAFVRAHTRTNDRARAELEAERGLSALRTLCLEIMPIDRDRAQESRVVVAFWDRAVQDPELWNAHRANALNWRRQMQTFLDQARADGEIGDGVVDEVVIDQISSMNAGLQVMCLLMPDETTAARQIAALDAILDGLRASAAP
ncbi:MAG: TetR/AcrR family transcriptional regulator [Microbacterium sp.]|uniref:TetR/AcrR family transcriptional regulator n=1 Tax=Microbacterium sp. TaxID=51671 RepID=UPI001AD4A1DB|nr:TetR/AcrR family transcriptional regulator [Microbacterium sp.]MBN9178670.1 TetR/AcrR family transcriptional regulator [Microbacterium sp.]